MRPPAIASAVAVTLARTGNLRFQTTTIHINKSAMERHARARRELLERRGGHDRARRERRVSHPNTTLSQDM